MLALLKRLLPARLGFNRKVRRKIKSNLKRQIKRVIGLSMDDDSAIFESETSLSWIVYGGAGSGKTTCAIMPSIMSLIPDRKRGQVINDVKPEISHQIADMCVKYGRKFAVIDPTHAMGIDYPHSMVVNPLGNLIDAYLNNSPTLLLDIISFTKIIIKEQDNDPKNFYFRQTPREFLILAVYILLHRDPELVTPCGLTALLSDPDIWNAAIDMEAEEGPAESQSRAKQIQNLRDNDPEHNNQHYLAILSAMQMFADSAPLHEAGQDADVSIQELLKQNYIICICSNAKDSKELGVYYGLLFNSFLAAQMSGDCGATIMIIDEAAVTPCKELIEKVTIFRSFKLQVIFCAQSRIDLQRIYGEKLIATLEDNCARQYLQFANAEECERISKSLGEIDNVNYSLNESTDKIDLARTINTGRERLFPADELANMPHDHQLILMPRVGSVYCKKIVQNNLFPYAQDLAPNPHENGRMTPVCKVVLPFNQGEQA